MTPDSKRYSIVVIHGPNLNMLGQREPETYGVETLDTINQALKALGCQLGIEVTDFQSNSEGAIVTAIHQAFEQKIDGVIINPAAYTHTSVAIKDALLLLHCPVIEVHLSNIYKREAFRHQSMVSDVVTAQITGLGSLGYRLALGALKELMG
ncbi:AroQ [Desulforapulum autotrophicum HRM2]|uniref:3-dehydroquinate dehydratase n=1 Tax=Desulforapulum autotrophicum (strain ATCC 43914 / DSM 3382 / VKM B-1955 / HRM2) TaxID=177437 RepID=C0QI59_DESAH|nr:type II 3-dehydroquinate dehydratase [Desulforapulum autotrophicum]ACN15795.1 AroQ [Desulforapulum autotrophicum HRM2]